jgi:hypothetical protein
MRAFICAMNDTCRNAQALAIRGSHSKTFRFLVSAEIIANGMKEEEASMFLASFADCLAA